MLYDNQIIEKEVKKKNARVVVVGISGGIDSAVTVSLATKAIGLEKVFGLILPVSSVREKSAFAARLSGLSFGSLFASLFIDTNMLSIVQQRILTA